MDAFTKVADWGDGHCPKWMSYARIALGILLVYKGLEFMFNIQQLRDLPGGMNTAFMSLILSHYVIYAHFVGGVLIAIGLFTRFAAIIQLPILIGAVFLVNAPKGFMSVGNMMELEISLLALILLIALTIFGAGHYSLDEKRKKAIGRNDT